MAPSPRSEQNADSSMHGPLSPVERSTDAVVRTFRALYQVGNLRLRQWDLTLSGYAALKIIKDQPDLSLSQLARRSFVRPQTMTRIVRQLEARGYVERGPHVDRARAISLRLTGSGGDALVEMDSEVLKVNDTIGAVLAPREIEQLDHMLRACAHAIETDITALER